MFIVTWELVLYISCNYMATFYVIPSKLLQSSFFGPYQFVGMENQNSVNLIGVDLWGFSMDLGNSSLLLLNKTSHFTQTGHKSSLKPCSCTFNHVRLNWKNTLLCENKNFGYVVGRKELCIKDPTDPRQWPFHQDPVESIQRVLMGTDQKQDLTFRTTNLVLPPLEGGVMCLDSEDLLVLQDLSLVHHPH